MIRLILFTNLLYTNIVSFDIILYRLEIRGTQHSSLRERNTSSDRTERELVMEQQRRDTLQVGNKLYNIYNHTSVFS